MRLRNTKLDVTGRSLVLNVAAIIINLIAVFLLVKGFHESTTSGAMMMKIAGFVLIAVTLFSLTILKGMFLFSYVARVLVGGLFIVSGLVKANDPWGFAFKLEEYFEPSGLSYDFPFFEAFSDYVLPLSILICVAEIVLGAAVILGGKIKLASWSLVIMMVFFTWLTWYTYSCNVSQLLALEQGAEFGRQCVTDCGCFGDALRGSVGRSLTPFESFWKDLVLFYLCLVIFVNQWKIQLNTVKENWIMVPASIVVIIFFSWVFGWMFPIIFALIALLGAFVVGNLNIGKIAKPWKMAAYVGFVSLLFSLYTANYLPFKDYRPYAVGNNIKEQMNNGVDQVAEYFMVYENLATGEMVSVSTSEWSAVYSDETKFRYDTNEMHIIVEGVDASIVDFAARVDYADLADNEKKIPLVDSTYKADFESYFEEKLVLSSINGLDTISAWQHDTLYYPDSVYTKKSTFTDLIDPSMPFSVDMTEYLIAADYMFLMTIRDIENINEKSMDDFKAVLEGARANDIPFFVLCPATDKAVDEFKLKYDFDATFLGFDGTEVKIIVRSNPGLVLLEKGTILDKWPSRSIEDFEDIFENYITKQD